MSNTSDKIKRSKRLHADETSIKRQLKIAKQKSLVDKKTLMQPHRLVKHHAMDCGTPGCLMCANPRKVWGEKTIQEKKFYQQELHNEYEDEAEVRRSVHEDC